MFQVGLFREEKKKLTVRCLKDGTGTNIENIFNPFDASNLLIS